MLRFLTRTFLVSISISPLAVPWAEEPQLPVAGDERTPSTGLTDTLPDGSQAAEKQIPAFRIPDGFHIRLFATEPQLASPIAVGVGEQNRVFVAEEYRFHRGTEENRTRAFLLDDVLKSKR